jgi:hypothetical protein
VLTHATRRLPSRLTYNVGQRKMSAITREGITLGIALLGAALGLINLWRAIDRDRLRVRVIPRGYITSHGESGVCIDVINLSFIPVTISQVGFDLKSGEILLNATLQKDVPKRLEPRAAFTASLAAGVEKDPRFSTVTRAFARTACESRFTGTSKSLRGFIKAARASK